MDDLVLTLTARAMGTRFELVLVAPGARGLDEDSQQRAATQLRAAGEAAIEAIHDTEQRWSLFLATSRLTRLNQHGHERPLVLDLDDLELWRTVLAVHEASGGAFDPDVARAMHAAGFHEDEGRHAELGPRPEPLSTGEPDPTARGELRLEGRHLSLTAAGPSMDLGGIAKGHALDRAATELREAGVSVALLHGGTSSVLALDAPPGRAAWRVRAPLDDEHADLTIDLVQGALAASRSDSQRNTAGSGHILDPRTGTARSTPTASLVLAPSAALADAWATALCVDPTRRTAAEAMGATVLVPRLAERRGERDRALGHDLAVEPSRPPRLSHDMTADSHLGRAPH